MREKFRIQVPCDGIGGIIARSELPAMRLSAEEVRKAVADLTAALVRIEPPQQDPAPTEEQAVAMVQTIIRKLQRIANAVNYSVSVAFQPSAPAAPAPKISRRQDDDCSPDEKAIVNLALDLAPNPRPLSLQPYLPGRSVQWISAKLHRETRVRAQMPGSSAVEQAAVNRRVAGSNPARAAISDAAQKVREEIATKDAMIADERLANSMNKNEIDEILREFAEKNEQLAATAAVIEQLRRERDSAAEERALADKLAKNDAKRLREQLAAKDEVIERLRLAQNSAAVPQTRSWGLTQGATPMPDTGSIPWPDEKQKMRGR